MQEIIEKIKQGALWDFPGGVHPVENKSQSWCEEISHLPLPHHVYIPIKQHIGSDGEILVQEGEYVLKGQPLTASRHPFAVPVHASTSGTVISIKPHAAAHPSGLEQLSIHIESDHKDQWYQLSPIDDFTQLSKLALLERLCQSGISGLGGAGFPTHIKLASDKQTEILVINGVECEPYITSDDMLMQYHAEEIIQGTRVLEHILSPKLVVIAIEDNKPAAIEKMRAQCPKHYHIVSIPTKYPAGGEKQLIQILTGLEVPHHQHPIDIGVLMQNVGTCFAISQAIFEGQPLIQRVVTVTGGAVAAPSNFWALLGTPIDHLLQQAKYQPYLQASTNIVMGGPMMGFNLHSIEAPIIKTTNCLLLLADDELSSHQQEMACIRCGACVDACPANLLPQQLYWYSRAKDYDKAKEYQLDACIECGACAYVCPSHIPLVQYYRQAKAEISFQEVEKTKSDKAKARFESRKQRLEDDKKAREEKHKNAAAARLAKAEQQKDKSDNAVSSNKSDAVAAAIARAKAKKAQQQLETQNSSPVASTEQTSTEDDKKAKIAAAVARAKAKKAQQQLETQNSSPVTSTEQTPTEDDKKAKVAAAVARAKARKQQKDLEQEKSLNEPRSSHSIENKETKS